MGAECALPSTRPEGGTNFARERTTPGNAVPVGPSSPMTPRRILRRLAVPKLSPSTNVDVLLDTQQPILDSVSFEEPPNQHKPPSLSVGGNENAKVAPESLNSAPRHALTPSKRQNQSSPGEKQQGKASRSGKEGSKKSFAAVKKLASSLAKRASLSGVENAEESEDGLSSERSKSGQRTISSYFLPSPRKSAPLWGESKSPAKAAVERELFASDAQLAEDGEWVAQLLGNGAQVAHVLGHEGQVVEVAAVCGKCQTLAVEQHICQTRYSTEQQANVAIDAGNGLQTSPEEVCQSSSPESEGGEGQRGALPEGKFSQGPDSCGAPLPKEEAKGSSGLQHRTETEGEVHGDRARQNADAKGEENPECLHCKTEGEECRAVEAETAPVVTGNSEVVRLHEDSNSSHARMQESPPLESVSAPQAPVSPASVPSAASNPCPALRLSTKDLSLESIAPAKAPTASTIDVQSPGLVAPSTTVKSLLCIEAVPEAQKLAPPKTAPLQSQPYPPPGHVSKLTPYTIDEMCAALLADIEDLPTTVPFHTTDLKPLKPSTQDEMTVERLIIEPGAGTSETAVDVGFSERTVEQMVFAEASTSEEEAEVRRRERLVQRRRKGRMAVTDLCALEWCEMQVDFSAKVGKPAPTPVMQAGTARHEQLEREVITRVEVPVTTREDAWALKLLNMITGLRQLLHEGMTRELYIIGRLEGHWVVGVIDELRMVERGGVLGPMLCDTKTRRSLKPPSDAQKRNGMLQLMCYKLLFDQLVWESRFPAGAFFQHFNLNAHAPLSADVVEHAAAECSLHVAALEDVMAGLATECRFFPVAHQTLLLRYEWQERRTVWAEEEFEFHEQWAKERVAWHLHYWFGKRHPEVVPEDERWKCRFCAFRDACPVGKSVQGNEGLCLTSKGAD